MGVSLVKRIVSLDIEKAYTELKTKLLRKNCKITAEKTPVHISVMQGSLWGISPVTAKKNVNCHLATAESGTRITCYSSMASDWKNLTIIGCVLSVFIIALCLWMTTDLDAFVATQQQSYWSWIATVDSYVDIQTAHIIADLTRMLAFLLTIILAAEAAVVVYVHFKISTFAEETLNSM